MNTFRFVAHRRGKKVIIKGKAPVSFLKRGPYLKPLREPQTRIRTYQLCYAQETESTVEYAEELALVVYEEMEMPDVVRLIRIKLPGDAEFLIKRQKRWK